MKTLPSSERNSSALLDIQEAEEKLEHYSDCLAKLSEEIDEYDIKDPRRLKSLKLLSHEQMNYGKDATRVLMMKAMYGIVGKSWYNASKDTDPKV